MDNLFIKKDINGLKLVFMKSTNVKAYPCGRRRSIEIDADGLATTQNDSYYIPFDPEARLNTEANNRKHSSLNGFTQTYIDSWKTIADTDKTELCSVVLAGYIFNINFDKIRKTRQVVTDDGTTKEESFEEYPLFSDIGEYISENANNVYVNIRLEEAPLFSSTFAEYNTSILRNQTLTQTPALSLDIFKDTINSNANDANDYYFSGLSFTAGSLAGYEFADFEIKKDNYKDFEYKYEADATNTRSSVKIYKKETGKLLQQVISLCILEKIDGRWQINQRALLPKIEHGDIENSIKVGSIVADDLRLTGTDAEGQTVTRSVPAVQLHKVVDTENTYQLKFFNVDIIN
jgi:hypothetical protein